MRPGLRACFAGGAEAMESGAAVADRAAAMTSPFNAEFFLPTAGRPGRRPSP